jgi:hypothetical protein
MSRRHVSALAVLTVAACSAPVALVDIDGHTQLPQRVGVGEVHVVVFLSRECPIANSYSATLGELARGFSGQPVRLFLVHVGDVDAAGAREHARTWALPGTILLDPGQRLARELGISRTPEAVVLSGAGLVYRGRIDDQWRAIGSRAASASQHDLRDAVAAALAGRAVPTPHPAAVGCLLPEPKR